MKVKWYEFSSPQALARDLANKVSGELAKALSARNKALLAISGGTTPRLFLEELSSTPIHWERTAVTLADERFVPPSSERSNARLALRHFFKNRASDAEFVPLYHSGSNIEEAAEWASKTIAALPLPLDVLVLGMGNDGHTASLFPDAENIGELLATLDGPPVQPVVSEAAQEPRLTLSMPVLCAARAIFLHIEGDDKRAVLEQALAKKSNLPIRAVIERAGVPVHVYWAPKG
jgi:6-phosphogluconolactonase